MAARFAWIAIERPIRSPAALIIRINQELKEDSLRRAHRLDSNHAQLMAAFEKLGCSVLSLAGLGNGVPDVCVGYGGLQIMCEFKDGAKPPSARKLTSDEERFKMNWRGGYKVVENLDHVQETVEVLQGWHAKIRS